MVYKTLATDGNNIQFKVTLQRYDYMIAYKVLKKNNNKTIKLC